MTISLSSSVAPAQVRPLGVVCRGGAAVGSSCATEDGYFAAHGRPDNPNDLLGHACIRHRFPNGSIPPWEFEKDGETVRIVVNGPLVTTNTHLALAAAEAGVGLLHTFEGLATEALAAGRLVRVLDDWCQPFDGPFLYYPSRRHVPAGLRAFIDFVRKRRSLRQPRAKRR
jgi:DNA-binding transcriptional LysR family regulator